eukprot:CAMPEP_0117076860 /NCGR_PEP_ID=MMETSP0472-20121206/54179_1 /TAXON_ID=693140 ORGANISM="Tiarina fusus, Strain LIS" /NCGR_SAMPLE_ID=MMETSP0472 /ASSEMBLY_ACC=CAM_ASM_000603 /LENGTH=31 /DNA_ID= /DNA_START= /DNA_END= /DNA_ORIENTATION=
MTDTIGRRIPDLGVVPSPMTAPTAATTWLPS